MAHLWVIPWRRYNLALNMWVQREPTLTHMHTDELPPETAVEDVGPTLGAVLAGLRGVDAEIAARAAAATEEREAHARDGDGDGDWESGGEGACASNDG